MAKRVTFADRLPEELGAGTPATEVEVHLSARSRPPLRCTRPCAALEVWSQSKGLVDGMQSPIVTLLGLESDQMVEDASGAAHSEKTQYKNTKTE